MSFRSETLEALGNYVYALSEPVEEGAIFYVGKGTGNRCFAHALEERTDPDYPKQQDSVMSLKIDKIQEIRKEYSADPSITIIAHGIEDSETAFLIESILIKGLKGLTNAVAGRDTEDLWLSASEVDNRYASPINEKDLGKKVLLVSLNGGEAADPYPKIKDNAPELARRTLGSWGLAGKNAKKVELVIGVYRGLVRCVFEVHKIKSGKSLIAEHLEPEKYVTEKGINKARYRFVGERNHELEKEWACRPIVRGEENLTVFPRGGAIRYANFD